MRNPRITLIEARGSIVHAAAAGGNVRISIVIIGALCLVLVAVLVSDARRRGPEPGDGEDDGPGPGGGGPDGWPPPQDEPGSWLEFDLQFAPYRERSTAGEDDVAVRDLLTVGQSAPRRAESRQHRFDPPHEMSDAPMITTPTTVLFGLPTAARLHHLHMAWRRESAAVQLAYERWGAAEREIRELAYAGYLAALDQEAHAADGYRDEFARMLPAVRRAGS